MSLQWIILASPPCEVYSRANTTGKVDEVSLKAADELVSCIFLFMERLGAIATVVENPSTGRLPNRSVSTFTGEYGTDTEARPFDDWFIQPMPQKNRFVRLCRSSRASSIEH